MAVGAAHDTLLDLCENGVPPIGATPHHIRNCARLFVTHVIEFEDHRVTFVTITAGVSEQV
jgi:hypothetical protein